MTSRRSTNGDPVAPVNTALEPGQVDFGENDAWEPADKVAGGTLQAHKSTPAARHCRWMHGLDRLYPAKHLNAQRPEGTAPLRMRLGGPLQHHDVAPEQRSALAESVS